MGSYPLRPSTKHESNRTLINICCRHFSHIFLIFWQDTGWVRRHCRQDSFQESQKDSFQESQKDSFQESQKGSFLESQKGSFQESRMGSFLEILKGSFQESQKGSFQESRMGSFQESQMGSFQESQLGIGLGACQKLMPMIRKTIIVLDQYATHFEI